MPADRFDRVATSLLVASALVIATAVVYRSLGAAPERSRPVASVDYVDDWREVLAAGRQIGSATADVQLIEFIDLECPFCRAFSQTLERVHRAYGTRLGITLVHFPLPMHRFAQQAARVAECGVPEGKFAQLVSAIVSDADSLGLNRWQSYGRQAGIRDTAAFRQCTQQSEELPLIQRGILVGDSIGIRATPTVLVNGWRFALPPTEQELRAAIEATAKGKKPPVPLR